MDTQDTFAKAYEVYLMSNIPQSIQDDVQRLLNHSTPDDTSDGQNTADNTSHGQNEHTDNSDHQNFQVEDWMLICQHRMQVDETSQNQTNPVVQWQVYVEIKSKLRMMKSLVVMYSGNCNT